MLGRNVKSLIEKVGTRDFLFDLGFEEDDIEVLVTKGFDALLRGERKAPPLPVGATSPSFLALPPPGTEASPAVIALTRQLSERLQGMRKDYG